MLYTTHTHTHTHTHNHHTHTHCTHTHCTHTHTHTPYAYTLYAHTLYAHTLMHTHYTHTAHTLHTHCTHTYTCTHNTHCTHTHISMGVLIDRVLGNNFFNEPACTLKICNSNICTLVKYSRERWCMVGELQNSVFVWDTRNWEWGMGENNVVLWTY